MTSNKRWTVLIAALSLVSTWAVGCAGPGDDGQSASASPAAGDGNNNGTSEIIYPTGTKVSTTTGESVVLTDAQIIGVMRTANAAEVQEAKLATTKEVAAEVGDFANQMITAHNASNQDLEALASRLDLTPAPSGITIQLQNTAKSDLLILRQQTGAQFDRVYIDSQVADHAELLFIIDSQLIPNVKNAELAAMLRKFRVTVKEHLDESVKIQTALGPPALGTGNNG